MLSCMCRCTTQSLLLLSTEDTAIWSVCAQSFCCVASCFHPWKSQPFIHDPRCLDLHSVWWEAPSSNSSATLKPARIVFFHPHEHTLFVSQLHIDMWCMHGFNTRVSGSYMYTLALVLFLTHIKAKKAQHGMLFIETNKVRERQLDWKAAEKSGLISNNEMYNVLCG